MILHLNTDFNGIQLIVFKNVEIFETLDFETNDNYYIGKFIKFKFYF